jgi:hypothetical protein
MGAATSRARVRLGGKRTHSDSQPPHADSQPPHADSQPPQAQQPIWVSEDDVEARLADALRPENPALVDALTVVRYSPDDPELMWDLYVRAGYDRSAHDRAESPAVLAFRVWHVLLADDLADDPPAGGAAGLEWLRGQRDRMRAGAASLGESILMGATTIDLGGGGDPTVRRRIVMACWVNAQLAAAMMAAVVRRR